MKTFSRVSIVLLFLLLSLTAGAQESVRVTSQKYQRQTLNGRCRIESSYPEIVGRPDLTAKIKALLPQPVSAQDLEPGVSVFITHDFEVTYNSKGLLSVFGAGISTRSRNGEPAEAHPSKLFNGIVLDIKTGKAYSLREMFGQDVYSKLDAPISKGVAKILGSEDTEPLSEHSYRAYLSQTGVTFYQIFSGHALSSVEVTIPYAEAVKYRGPKSPLERFAKP